MSASVARSEVIEFLENCLQPSQFKDYAPNGLQVEGCDRILKICTAVTASQSVIDACIEAEADTLLVHHGYFWRGESPVLVGPKKARIEKLLCHKINLLAYHLPLDCHKDYGNNACLARRLHIGDLQQEAAANTEGLLWYGAFSEPLECDALSERITNALQRQPLIIKGHVRPIKTIAWCSGGAQDFIHEAARLGVDAYMSGEVSERTYYDALEHEIVYISAGHHATERYGVQSLGALLESTFSIPTFFVDSDNPV